MKIWEYYNSEITPMGYAIVGCKAKFSRDLENSVKINSLKVFSYKAKDLRE
jgi:hypothetical protein